MISDFTFSISRISLIMVLIFSGIQMSAQDKNSDEKVINEWELPRTARDFIAHNFPEQKINVAKRKEVKKKEYEVVLDNEFELEFDELGYWTEVSGKGSTIPTAFILKKVTDYAAQKYPKQKIIKVEKDTKKYEIELNNGTDLEFDIKGKFLKADKN